MNALQRALSSCSLAWNIGLISGQGSGGILFTIDPIWSLWFGGGKAIALSVLILGISITEHVMVIMVSLICIGVMVVYNYFSSIFYSAISFNKNKKGFVCGVLRGDIWLSK